MSTVARLFPVRENLAVRYATGPDIERIEYSRSLSRWCKQNLGLRARAIRYLEFFGALIITGNRGYRGTRVTHGKLAYHEARTSQQYGSVRTLHRALHDLRDAGYIRTRTKRTGDWRQLNADGTGARDPVCEITFTSKLTAIFDGSSPVCDKKPHVTVGQGNDLLILDSSSLRSSEYKRTTHIHTYNKARSESEQLKDRLSSTPSSKGNLPTAKSDPCATVDKTSGHPVGNKSTEKGNRNSRSRPLSALPPRTRKEKINFILQTLATVGATKPILEAKFVIARAQAELCASSRMRGHSGIDWDFWIKRWETQNFNVRRYWARNDIWPALTMYEEEEENLSSDLKKCLPVLSGVSNNGQAGGMKPKKTLFAIESQEKRPPQTKSQLLTRLKSRVENGEITESQLNEMYKTFEKFLK